MERENPPAYLAWIPAVFLAIALGFVFIVTAEVMETEIGGGWTDPLASFEKDFSGWAEDIDKTIRQIVSFIERQQGPPRPPPRHAQRPLGEPVVLVDFARINPAHLKPLAAAGFTSDFAIAEKKAGSPGVALLEVIMSAAHSSGSSASGMVALSPPTDVTGKQALEIMLKGEGLATVGVGILQKGGAGSYRWDWPEAKVTGGWAAAQLRFADAVLWEYDAKSRRYRKMSEWKEPDKIGQLRFYVKPGHLEKGTKAKLWIGTVSAR